MMHAVHLIFVWALTACTMPDVMAPLVQARDEFTAFSKGSKNTFYTMPKKNENANSDARLPQMAASCSDQAYWLSLQLTP
jgi:hypothetical protein